MRTKENIGLLYIYGYFSVVVGNLLIDSHELITHHVSVISSQRFVVKMIIYNNFTYSPKYLLSYCLQNHGENNVDHFTNIWYFYTTDDSNGTHEAIIQQGFSYAKPVRLKHFPVTII